MPPLLVGLDVGTTASKAMVFTSDGETVGEGRSVTPWSSSARGTEMDAGALAAAATDAVGQALADAPDGPVLGLGVTSMGESGVLLDRVGAPLAPVIAWHDHRDEAEVRDLASSIGRREFAVGTGLPLRGQWSVTKHRWLVTHHPAAASAVRWLNAAEWIVRAFGGEEAAEQSLASRTGWLGLAGRDWWSDTMAWSGARETLMPSLVTAGTPLGRATDAPGVPRLTGAVLTVAGHDHQAACVGTGAWGPGDVLDSCGTAEALLRTIPAGLDGDAIATLADAGVTTGWHVLADRWCLLGDTQGGLALRRVLGLLGAAGHDLAGLDRQALAPGRTGLTVDGVGTERLTVSGIGDQTRPADLWLAALEAVTDAAVRMHETMSASVGAHRKFVVAGGWSRSKALLALKRRAIDAVHVTAVAEAGARGAAMFAGLATGVFERADDFSLWDDTRRQPACTSARRW